MNKVIVIADESLKNHRRKRPGGGGSTDRQRMQPENAFCRRYESWVPLDYSVAQLKHDVARYWQLKPSSRYQLFGCDDELLLGEWRLDFLGQQPMTFTLKKAGWSGHNDNAATRSTSRIFTSTAPPSCAIINTTSFTSTRDKQEDPFWVQEKLFELFLFHALQNVNGKVLWITCYQFKNLLQRATAKSAFQTKKAHKLDFDTRVVLAFKSSAPNSTGAGANFDEFLDAMVDVACFMFPKVSSKELAFERLTTKYVIPMYELELEYTGGASSLSWNQMDELLAKQKVHTVIQRFAKTIGDLAAPYSTTIGGSRSYRGLQFHDFSKFVQDTKPKSMSMSANELCKVFLRCCRAELSHQHSESTAFASLHFSGSNTAPSSTGGFEHERKKTRARNATSGGIFTTHGSSGSDASTNSGGALEIMCAKMMGVFGYLALIAVPQLVKMKDQLHQADFSTMHLSSTLALQSVKAFLHHIANHLSGKSFHHSRKNASFALARIHFLQEFHKLHQEDSMEDYLSSLSEEIRELTHRRSNNNEQVKNAPENHPEEADDDLAQQDKGDADERLDLLLDWGVGKDGDGSDDSDDDDENGTLSGDSVDTPLTSLDPHTLRALRERELADLTSVLDEGDEIYSFLASELQRHVLEKRVVEDTDTVPQMLDIWVAAGQKYAHVLSHVDPSPQVKAAFLQRFGCSLYVFAIQLLKSTTKVYRYEEFFYLTNARVYGVKTDFWDDSDAVFTTDLAMETLSLASGKLLHACLEFASQLPSSRLNDDSDSENGNLQVEGTDEEEDPPQSASTLYEKYIECLLHRANCLSAYGDILAHNSPCIKDYELGCALEEELENLHTDQERLPVNSSSAAELYRSTSTLSKTSTPGQFYREANRMYRFAALHSKGSQRFPLHRVHHALSMTQFKLATHLPRGCVAEKKLLEEALVNLAICQKSQAPEAVDMHPLVQQKEYISAILVLRHKFFQPEGPPNRSSTRAHPPRPSDRKQHSEATIAPFYRFVLAAAFKDFDAENDGVLSQQDLSLLNKACRRSSVSDTVMQWLLGNFDHQNNGLTEEGLLEYFCWVAEADPLAFCEILDIFTSKYTETHHASIASSRPHISKDSKAKSLRSILFAERQQTTTVSSAGKDRPVSGKKGIAECVIVLSGKMTPETCGNLRNTKAPSDVRLDPEVVDVLPSNASLPDELSKFCFPDDAFLYDEPLPPKTFDIVLTDIPRVLSTAISALDVDFIASYSDGVVRIQSPGANPVTSEQLCPDELHTARPNVSADRMYTGTAGVLPHRSRLYNLVPVPQSRKHPQGKLCFSIVANASGLSFSNRLIARVKVYGYLLTEKKLVLCSVNYSILTPVTETLRALLHPFECQLVYIPVLPLSLLDFVSAPVPFFMGVRSDTRVDRLTSEGVIVVDLDKNDVLLPPNELLPCLPDVKSKKLLQALRKASLWASSQKSKDQFGRFRNGELSADIKSFGQLDPSEAEIAQLGRRHDDLLEKWSELQSLFTTFATRLLKDFRKYCTKANSPNEPTETIAFDKRSFLTMHPSLREFCTHLFQTQLFQRFIEKNFALPDSGSGADQEPSWLSVRSKGVMWKSSDSVDESTKTPARQLVRAPLPFQSSDSVTSSGNTIASQKRACQSTLDAFPVFNAHAYDELIVRNSQAANGASSAKKAAISAPTCVEAAATPSLNPSLSFHSGNSPSSKLVSAARKRLEGTACEETY